LEKILFDATKLYEPYRPDYTEVLPPLVFSEEQSSELADLEATILDYVKQMNARFITGDADLETEWETYLKTLEDMNLERFIQIYQDAYDFKYKK